MCMEDAKSPSLVNFIEKNLPLSKWGSRRKRIWDLDGHTHCPIIGVCLPLAALRKLIGKVYLSAAYAPDYELHILSVNECATRNRLSESLQHELDRRYAQVITRFKTAKTTADVRKLWQVAVSDGDVAGALWAGLAHPRCTPELEEEICRDMHMLQHQAGASARVDLRKFQELQKEKNALAQELESVRQRSARALSEKSAEQENLHAMLMRARAECIGKDTLIASLQSELNELAAAVPGLESRNRLTQRIAEITGRQQALERQSALLRQQLEQAMQLAHSALAQASGTKSGAGTESEMSVATTSPPVLEEKTVLCVGGRSGSIAIYRKLIERTGGHFSHHDGGLEDNVHQLDANLAAADLVICQTGCISHHAYWRVKDFCKRTGKRCVFVENPSASGLARSLAEAAASNH